MGERATSHRSWVVAVDVGGTFTDAVAHADDGSVVVAKVPSTPADPAEGFVSAVGELTAAGVSRGDVRLIAHGTTIATNALLTGGTARVVLLATEGFRDVLGYRNGTRPHLYDLELSRPVELVRRRDRVEVRERISGSGAVLTPLTDDEIARAVDAVARRQPEAVAVSLLFSYLDDRHERAIGDALAARLPNVPVSLSSDVAREFREFPRTATVAVNASLRPVVGSYLLRAKRGLDDVGLRSPLLVMQSNGGSVPAERAEREAHRLILSGPAAGVTGAAALGARYGLDRIVSLDMGGTSVDVCLVRDGIPPVRSQQEILDHPVVASTVDIAAAGAGGGSIVRVDASGALRVGPESAGADPGPAAYGLGAKEPTLTDAHVVTGALGRDTPLAGRLALDPDAAVAAVAPVGEALGLEPEAAARGIAAVATAHLVRAIRRVSVERGEDPRGYTLVAYGGAGPMHAGSLLRELGLSAVVVPPHPGLFSASGLVSADLRVDDAQTVLRVLEPGEPGELVDWYREAAAGLVERLREDGVPRRRIRVVASADCRYLGQGFELTVPLRGSGQRAVAGIAPAFHELHRATYGHSAHGDPIEVVTLRLSAFGGLPRADPPRIGIGTPEPPSEAVVTRRLVHMPETARVPVFRREGLLAGNGLGGPAIVEEMDATTLVLRGQHAEVDDGGCLWIREDGRAP